MVDNARAAGAERSLLSRAAAMAVALAALSLLLLALAPLGWRLGLWNYRTSFTYLMASSAYVAIAGVCVAAVTLIFLRASVGRRGTWQAVAALVVSAVLVYVPWQWTRLAARVPPIDDITTDTVNPPRFAAVLPARQAEDGNSTVYGGAKLASVQKAAYPDIAPAILPMAPDQAFHRALDTATAMSGWTIVATDPERRIIEASQSSFWFGFTDDIVIRVEPDGSGSRVDMRSESRHGRGDFGVNAARIRKYMAALKDSAG
jgi:uncharacterized protein (DUF1499 family)